MAVGCPCRVWQPFVPQFLVHLCTLEANNAGYGSGMYVNDTMNIFMESSALKNNAEHEGGGAETRFLAGNVTIQGCSIQGNQANARDGWLIGSGIHPGIPHIK